MLKLQNKSLLSIILLLGIAHLVAQQNSHPRLLRACTETADTLEVRVQYDDDGSIRYLFQSYMSYKNGTTYVHDEEYRKGKFWTLWQYQEVLKKERRRVSVYKPVLHGPQRQFTMDGHPLYQEEFELGTALPVFREWEYYPDGALKYVAEVKDKRYWNYLNYYYPDGTVYDYGDFHNGTGRVVHLDDDGNPCLECQQLEGKVRGKLLCDEQKEE